MRNGKLLICITWNGTRLHSVKSFALNNYYDIPVEYLMYPVKNKAIEIWSDSFTYLEDEDVLYAFGENNGSILTEERGLRTCSEGRHEEWFLHAKGESQGGGTELTLLRKWLELHPNIVVDDPDENRANKIYRMFVDV